MTTKQQLRMLLDGYCYDRMTGAVVSVPKSATQSRMVSIASRHAGAADQALHRQSDQWRDRPVSGAGAAAAGPAGRSGSGGGVTWRQLSVAWLRWLLRWLWGFSSEVTSDCETGDVGRILEP